MGQVDSNQVVDQAAILKKRKWRIILIGSIIVLIAALVSAGAFFWRYWSQQNAYTELENHVEILENTNDDSPYAKLSSMSADWDALKAINPDIVGWIYIPGSRINYPVVQGQDNESYLHTAFDGSNGWFSSAGTIFLDYKNNSQFLSQNSFLYGHHMRDGSMFASLVDWANTPEFNKHRDIYILTPRGNFYLKSFAMVKSTGSEVIVVRDFEDEEAYRKYIQNKLDRSIVKQEGDVFTANDINQSVALATCEYTQNDGRMVLFATVVATTAQFDHFVEADPNALTGIKKGENLTFG